MLQLQDRSPFSSGIFVLPDARGVEALVVVIKATFRIGAGLELADEQRELVLADAYWGEPGASSLHHPAEVHPSKPGTDVLLLGDACSPRERPVTELDVVVRVAGREKRARVYGDRFWTEGVGGVQPSRAQPFVRVPLIYERAYGGREPQTNEDGSFAADLRNPVGLGFTTGHRKQLLGHPVPNIDDPRQPLTKLGQSPAPLGFGPVAPHWQPRVAHAGTYDEQWVETRAPFLPLDFDSRFLNTAPTDQWFPDGLHGGEPVALSGLHPRGLCEFALPQCRFELDVKVATEHQHPRLELDTVVLEPTDEILTMLWRAVIPLGERVLQVERVDVELSKMQGAVEPGKASR